jgi:hypothetical protein
MHHTQRARTLARRAPLGLVKSLAAAAALLGVPSISTAQQRDTTRARPDTATRRPATPPPVPTAARQQPAGVRRDTLLPPITPRRAFFYSAALPGLAQTRLRRPVAGALFFTAEVIGIALANKAAYDLRYAKQHEADSVIARYDVGPGGELKAVYERNRYADPRVKARQTHLEDWYAFLAFNHLLAGAEAFVSANLWDLPGRVSGSATPHGAALVWSIPW